MSELYIKQELIKTLPQIDAIILDIDGVILDVSQSFRVVISETTQYYATEKLGLEDTGTLLELDEIDGFKMAGGFNSDWDLTVAAVALVIAKQAISGATDTNSVREAGPSWTQFTDEIKRRGGGPVAAEQFVLELMTPTERREYSLNSHPKLVVQWFQERYAGVEECENLYGYEPETLKVEGYYQREKLILDTSFLPNLPLGILTGRTANETQLALKMARLQIAPNHRITESDGVRKPDGRTLVLLQEKMKFKNAVFIGDTWDDWQTVVDYRKFNESGRAKIYGCIVLDGPNAARHRKVFLEDNTEIIAPDVNLFLAYLKSVLKK